MNLDQRIDIDKPLWDQTVYIGRWKHFAFLTDVRTIFVTEKKLREAKQLCDDYKMGKIPPGTQISDIIRAKQLRDSAFHPHTGELLYPLARLSYQIPTAVALTTSMLAFQKTTIGIVLLQLINQLHNALINHTYKSTVNHKDSHSATNTTFICAILASSIITIGIKKKLHQKGPVLAKTVSFCAVAAGHITNLPIMRQKDITVGVPLFFKDPNHPFMNSKVAGVKSLTECFITRILMSVPCLLLLPILSEKFIPIYFPQRRPWFLYTLETSLCLVCCVFSIPCGLAIFPEINSMNPEWLRLIPEEYEQFKRYMDEHVDKVYYKKGL